jgi:hypothetical protein
MEIPLFQPDETLRFERIVLYPYPDLKRVWTRAWLTAVPDQEPNIEFRVLNPDGTENTSIYMMARTEQRVETTLHLRDSMPGTTYRIIAELTVGIAEDIKLQDRHEFDLVLEFRDPDAGDAGFGMGVDWDTVKQNGAPGTA